MSWLKGLKVGDSVFVNYSSRFKESRYVSIQKIGRKWIELADYNGRIDKTQETPYVYARIDCQYGSPDTVYPDHASFEYQKKIRETRKAIENGIRSLTNEQVVAIAEIMGLSNES